MASGADIKTTLLGDVAVLVDGTDYKSILLGARVTVGFAFAVEPKDVADSGDRQYANNVNLSADDLAVLSKDTLDELKALAESKLAG